jgi:hypothetical protein
LPMFGSSVSAKKAISLLAVPQTIRRARRKNRS